MTAFSRQTRASPSAVPAASSGFQRHKSAGRPSAASCRLPLNRAENGLAEPKNRRYTLQATLRTVGFQDRCIQPLCHPSPARAMKASRPPAGGQIERPLATRASNRRSAPATRWRHIAGRSRRVAPSTRRRPDRRATLDGLDRRPHTRDARRQPAPHEGDLAQRMASTTDTLISGLRVT
jgi:hypothetical protein